MKSEGAKGKAPLTNYSLSELKIREENLELALAVCYRANSAKAVKSKKSYKTNVLTVLYILSTMIPYWFGFKVYMQQGFRATPFFAARVIFRRQSHDKTSSVFIHRRRASGRTPLACCAEHPRKQFNCSQFANLFHASSVVSVTIAGIPSAYHTAKLPPHKLIHRLK